MNPEWRKYAPVGLMVSLLALVAAAVFYFLYRTFNLQVQISLGVFVLGLAAFAILDPDRVRISFTGRQARYGSNALVLTLAVLGVLIVVNYLVFQNSKQWDLTEDKNFTLSTETLDALGRLKEPVLATGFYSTSSGPEGLKQVLDQYKVNGKGQFSYELINYDEEPVAAEIAKVSRSGTVVLNMGENQETVTSATEQELTNGLLRLMNPEKHKIYFLTGHGERQLAQSGQTGLSQIKLTLEGQNFQLDSVNLLASKVIPTDAEVIVIAGPMKPVTVEEVELLKQFLAGGGVLIVAEEPLVMTEFGEQPDNLADYLAQTWGVILGNNFVVDQTSQQELSWAIGADWGSHAIVEKLQGYVAVLPSARSVSLAAVEGVSQVNLVSTYTFGQSWGETDMQALSQGMVKLDEADLMGPVPLAAVAENQSGMGKVVVFGDVDFMSDSFYQYSVNLDLFVNTIDWAVGKEDLINLTPKDTTTRTLNLPPQKVTMGLMLLGLIVVIPGVPLVAGVVTWIRRRRRG